MQEAEGRLLKQRSREFGALDELAERLLRLNHPLGISLVPHAYAAQKTVVGGAIRRFRSRELLFNKCSTQTRTVVAFTQRARLTPRHGGRNRMDGGWLGRRCAQDGVLRLNLFVWFLTPAPGITWQCRMRRLNEPETRRTLSPVRQPLPGAPRVEDKVEDLTSVYTVTPDAWGAGLHCRAETRMSVLRTFRHSHTVSSQPAQPSVQPQHTAEHREEH